MNKGPTPGTWTIDDFRILIEHSPDAISRFDRELRFLYLNAEGFRQLVLAPSQVIGKTMGDIGIKEPYRTLWEDRIRRIFASGQPLNVIDTFPVNGGVRHFESRCVPEQDTGGLVRSVLVICRDVTEQILAREALAESEEKFRRLAENSPNAIFELDLDGFHRYVSPATTEIFGYSVEETIGAHFSQYLPEHKLEEAFLIFAKVLSGESVRSYVSEAVRKDGRRIVAEFSVAPILKDGRLTGIQGITRDITAQKEAEKALVESQKNLETFFNAISESAFLMDTDGVILAMNRTMAERFGRVPEDMIGRVVFDFIHENTANDRKKRMREVIRTGSALEFEDMRLERHYRHSIYPVKNGTGEVVRMAVFTQDIHDRKNTEQALRESEEKYRLIFGASPIGIIYYNADGIVTECNAKVLQLTGADHEALIGFNLLEKIQSQPFLDAIRKSLAGISSELEGKYRSITGSRESYLRSLLTPIHDDHQAIVGGLCLVEDISEKIFAEKALKESENRYRLLFENAPVGISLTDTEGHLREFNQAVLKMFGYTDSEAWQLNLNDVYAEPGIRMLLIAELKKQGTVTDREVRFLNKSGKIMDVLMNLRIVVIENKDHILAMLTDITRQKQDEKFLADSRQELRNLTRHLQNIRESERIRMARELHDELGQVLTVINMEAARLAKKIPDRLKTLKPGAETISAFSVGAIRSLKRIISELRPALLNDLGLAAAINWQAREYQERTGIRFEVNITPDEFDVGEELGTALFRIFQESTTNVLRHAKASEVRVRMEKQDKEIVLTVEDNGIGFSPENLPINGSLGLMGMRERAEMLGGALDISSHPTTGTALRCRVPCQEDLDNSAM